MSAMRVTSDSTAGINEEGSDDMAEHRVKKDNIIYIIPNDELFDKLMNNEAFIDDYGRLMNRRPHRVLKELKHFVDNTPVVSQRITTPPATLASRSLHVKDCLKDSVRDTVMDISEVVIDRAVDAFFYEVLPNVWHEHIVPFYHRTKAALTSKELKADAVLARAKASMDVAAKPKPGTKMTQEEADTEKRKVLYYWLGLLSSLKKLHEAGEMDIDSTLAQLTDPAMLKRVNGFLSENPNLLETDKYIVLHDLLGRDLYEEQQLIPIGAAEITAVAEKYGYAPRNDKMEDNHNG